MQLTHLVRNAGFALMELVITVVLIGMLSAVLLINGNAKAQHKVTTRADEFRRNLSHIQLLAISRGTRLRLTVAGTYYTVVSCPNSDCTTSPQAVSDPTLDIASCSTGLNFTVNFLEDNCVTPDGVTIAPVSPTLSTLDFDSLGRPVSGTTLVSGISTYTLSVSGSGNCVDVTVRPITGFAEAAPPRSC